MMRMSSEVRDSLFELDVGYPPIYKLYSISNESLIDALVDSLSIESLNLSLSGVFDGYSVILYNEWVARAGPFTYTYSLYKLIYEDSDFDLENLIESFGEDGLTLLLTFSFKDEVSPEEELAARELLESFFENQGLGRDFGVVLEELMSEARKKNRPLHKAYVSFIAHMLNKALNYLVVNHE